MKAGSAKAKGSRLERKVASKYRRIGIEAKRMPLSGAFSHLKADIFKPVPDGYHDECKNQETVKLKDWWGQASSTSGSSIPVLHISANHRPVITVMSSDTWYQLLKELKDIGSGYLHHTKKINKKRFNLWNEWNEHLATVEYGDPVMHIENMELTVVTRDHYMEIREMLL